MWVGDRRRSGKSGSREDIQKRDDEEAGKTVKKARYGEGWRGDQQRGGDVSTTNLSPSPPSPQVPYGAWSSDWG